MSGTVYFAGDDYEFAGATDTIKVPGKRFGVYEKPATLMIKNVLNHTNWIQTYNIIN